MCYVDCVECFAHVYCYCDCASDGLIYVKPVVMVLFMLCSAVLVE